MSIWDDINNDVIKPFKRDVAPWLNPVHTGQKLGEAVGLSGAARGGGGGGSKKSAPGPSTPSKPPPSLSDQVMTVLKMEGVPVTATDAQNIANGLQTLGINVNSPSFFPMIDRIAQQKQLSSGTNPLDYQTLYMQALQPALDKMNQQFLGTVGKLGGQMPQGQGYGAGLANQAVGQAKAGAGTTIGLQEQLMGATIPYDQMIKRMNADIMSRQTMDPNALLNALYQHIIPTQIANQPPSLNPAVPTTTQSLQQLAGSQLAGATTSGGLS